MKFAAEKLYDVALEMYQKAGFDLDEVREGIAQWASYSSEDEYADLEEVKEELETLIENDKKMQESLEN